MLQFTLFLFFYRFLLKYFCNEIMATAMKRFIRTISIRTFILIGTLFQLNGLQAQSPVSFYLVDRGWVGDTNFIEVRASKFQAIAGFQISIRERNGLGEFADLDRIQLANFFPGANFNYNLQTKTLNLAWNVFFVNGFNVPDGELLFRIKWRSNPVEKHCYEFLDGPNEFEVLDLNQNPKSYQLNHSCDVFTVLPSFFSAYIDLNKNCSYEIQESLFTQYTIQDSFNNQINTYKNPQFLIFNKSEYGLHFFRVIPVSRLWTACNNDQVVLVDSTTKIIGLSFGMQPVLDCPELNIEINTPVVRRCIDYNYYIHYENIGTLSADSVRIILKLDPLMSFKGSSIPISNVQLPYVEFFIGKLNVFESGSFTMSVQINCDSSVVGQTHCVTAEILPHKDCIVPAQWSGARIKLDAKCENGKNKFRIQNIGSQDMPEPTKYWIVEDDIMPGLKKDVQLNKGSFFDLEYPGNGKTYRLIVDQVKNHPGESHPTLAIEACGKNGTGGISTGYYLMFPEDEEDSNIAIDCQASRGSFDPNDKTGIPIGYQADHFIEPQRTIEYKIRFQNTGNDTAFKVVIVDTLSEFLDLSTLKILNSSHPFSFRMINRILSFSFDPIYLPYRAIDEERSQGFINYSIQSKTNAPLGSKIPNTASIYFDFNPPILTNTTSHTLNREFIIVSVEPVDPLKFNVNIYPNPGTDYLILETAQLSPDKDIQICDLQGHILLNQKWNGNHTMIQLNKQFKTGTYFLNIYENAKLLYRATIALKN